MKLHVCGDCGFDGCGCAHLLSSAAGVFKIAGTFDKILILAKLIPNGDSPLAWKFSLLSWRTAQLHIPTCRFDTLSSQFEQN
jgi:hypothetical protein